MARLTAEREMRDLARLLVRAGLTSSEETHRELTEAIERSLPQRDADATATQWLADARAALREEESEWPAATDHDALMAVFAACEQAGIRVLQGVADHWSAKEELDRLAGEPAGAGLRGILWFTQPDVWHAVDEGMLEVNLWHASTANAAPGDQLLEEVLTLFAEHGLPVHFDEGRIEVAAFWRRRL